MMCQKWLLIGLFVFAFSSEGPAQDLKKGEELYAKCVMCHGQKGEGNVGQQAPRIAGQHDWYIEKQLADFKAKKRSNPKMYPFIANLSAGDMKDLAAFIAQMK